MEWLGRWCADEAPDWIVQLGDLGTFDSVSAHAPPGTGKFSKLPRVEKDFEALRRGLDLFSRGAGRCKARRMVTLGNHENRLWRFEDRNPQTAGTYTTELDRTLRRAGWDWRPFGAYFMLGGVGFTHIPHNAGGKPYGGKHSAQAIARDATFSIVHGHTHVKQAFDAAKIGRDNGVRIISPGCALPWGHVEEYVKHSATGWWYGAACLTIRGGRILDESYVSMLTLAARYGSRGRSARRAA